MTSHQKHKKKIIFLTICLIYVLLLIYYRRYFTRLLTIEQLKDKTIEQSDLKNEYDIKNEILKWELLLHVPLDKPSDSKLLYPNEIEPITQIKINHKCDNDHGENLLVVIVVVIKVNGFERRNVLRNLWVKDAKNNEKVKLLFATGLTDDSIVQKHLEEENQLHNDIIQFGFIDSYYNLTLKSLAILRWATIECSRAKTMYKVDDDALINIDNLVLFINHISANSIYGKLWVKAKVRRYKDKFYLSEKDFQPDFFPDYVGGSWLISMSCVPLLYKTAVKSLPVLPFEDVFITGVLAEKINLKRRDLPGLIYLPNHADIDYCLFKSIIVLWQGFDDQSLNNTWNKILSTKDKQPCEKVFKVYGT